MPILLQRDWGDAVEAAIAGFIFVVPLVSSTYAAFRVSMPCMDMISKNHSVS